MASALLRAATVAIVALVAAVADPKVFPRSAAAEAREAVAPPVDDGLVEPVFVPGAHVPVHIFWNGNDPRDARVRMCALNHVGHRETPPLYPFFVDLVTSHDCEREEATPVRQLVRDIAAAGGGAAVDLASLPMVYDTTLRQLEGEYLMSPCAAAAEDIALGCQPSSFIFHEMRCGSTLTANMFAASASSLVYSEAAPPDSILLHNTMTAEEKAHWLRVIVAAMGRPIRWIASGGPRTSYIAPISAAAAAAAAESGSDVRRLPPWTPRFMHYKGFFQSMLDVHLLRAAFPRMPWIFVHREPVEVMMSLLRETEASPAVNASLHDHISTAHFPMLNASICMFLHEAPYRYVLSVTNSSLDRGRGRVDNPEDHCGALLSYGVASALVSASEDRRQVFGRAVALATLAAGLPAAGGGATGLDGTALVRRAWLTWARRHVLAREEGDDDPLPDGLALARDTIKPPQLRAGAALADAAPPDGDADAPARRLLAVDGAAAGDNDADYAPEAPVEPSSLHTPAGSVLDPENAVAGGVRRIMAAWARLLGEPLLGNDDSSGDGRLDAAAAADDDGDDAFVAELEPPPELLLDSDAGAAMSGGSREAAAWRARAEALVRQRLPDLWSAHLAVEAERERLEGDDNGAVAEGRALLQLRGAAAAAAAPIGSATQDEPNAALPTVKPDAGETGEGTPTTALEPGVEIDRTAIQMAGVTRVDVEPAPTARPTTVPTQLTSQLLRERVTTVASVAGIPKDQRWLHALASDYAAMLPASFASDGATFVSMLRRLLEPEQAEAPPAAGAAVSRRDWGYAVANAFALSTVTGNGELFGRGTGIFVDHADLPDAAMLLLTTHMRPALSLECRRLAWLLRRAAELLRRDSDTGSAAGTTAEATAIGETVDWSPIADDALRGKCEAESFTLSPQEAAIITAVGSLYSKARATREQIAAIAFAPGGIRPFRGPHSGRLRSARSWQSMDTSGGYLADSSAKHAYAWPALKVAAARYLLDLRQAAFAFNPPYTGDTAVPMALPTPAPSPVAAYANAATAAPAPISPELYARVRAALSAMNVSSAHAPSTAATAAPNDAVQLYPLAHVLGDWPLCVFTTPSTDGKYDSVPALRFDGTTASPGSKGGDDPAQRLRTLVRKGVPVLVTAIPALRRLAYRWENDSQLIAAASGMHVTYPREHHDLLRFEPVILPPFNAWTVAAEAEEAAARGTMRSATGTLLQSAVKGIASSVGMRRPVECEAHNGGDTDWALPSPSPSPAPGASAGVAAAAPPLAFGVWWRRALQSTLRLITEEDEQLPIYWGDMPTTPHIVRETTPLDAGATAAKGDDGGVATRTFLVWPADVVNGHGLRAPLQARPHVSCPSHPRIAMARFAWLSLPICRTRNGYDAGGQWVLDALQPLWEALQLQGLMATGANFDGAADAAVAAGQPRSLKATPVNAAGAGLRGGKAQPSTAPPSPSPSPPSSPPAAKAAPRNESSVKATVLGDVVCRARMPGQVMPPLNATMSAAQRSVLAALGKRAAAADAATQERSLAPSTARPYPIVLAVLRGYMRVILLPPHPMPAEQPASKAQGGASAPAAASPPSSSSFVDAAQGVDTIIDAGNVLVVPAGWSYVTVTLTLTLECEVHLTDPLATAAAPVATAMTGPPSQAAVQYWQPPSEALAVAVTVPAGDADAAASSEGGSRSKGPLPVVPPHLTLDALMPAPRRYTVNELVAHLAAVRGLRFEALAPTGNSSALEATLKSIRIAAEIDRRLVVSSSEGDDEPDAAGRKRRRMRGGAPQGPLDADVARMLPMKVAEGVEPAAALAAPVGRSSSAALASPPPSTSGGVSGAADVAAPGPNADDAAALVAASGGRTKALPASIGPTPTTSLAPSIAPTVVVTGPDAAAAADAEAKRAVNNAGVTAVTGGRVVSPPGAGEAALGRAPPPPLRNAAPTPAAKPPTQPPPPRNDAPPEVGRPKRAPHTNKGGPRDGGIVTAAGNAVDGHDEAAAAAATAAAGGTQPETVVAETRDSGARVPPGDAATGGLGGLAAFFTTPWWSHAEAADGKGGNGGGSGDALSRAVMMYLQPGAVVVLAAIGVFTVLRWTSKCCRCCVRAPAAGTAVAGSGSIASGAGSGGGGGDEASGKTSAIVASGASMHTGGGSTTLHRRGGGGATSLDGGPSHEGHSGGSGLSPPHSPPHSGVRDRAGHAADTRATSYAHMYAGSGGGSGAHGGSAASGGGNVAV